LTANQPTEKICVWQTATALPRDLRGASNFLSKENADGVQDKTEEEKEVEQSFHP
jgi:hypothetical protein